MIKDSIGISIVTYNSPDLFTTLDNFISEILPFFPCEIYIFDNNSNNTYQEKLLRYQNDNIHIHLSKKNSGFGYGHNYNITNMPHHKFVLICNPDIIIGTPDFKRVWDFSQDNPNSIIAPRVTNPDGSTQYLFRKKLDVFDYMLRFIPFKSVKKLFDQRLANYECRNLTNDIQPVNFASGCFMFTRRDEFIDVGGFDERFFMYFEDNDLCQKYRVSNKTIIYFPDASIIHYYGKEAHRSFKVFKIFIVSMIRYFNKWGWKFI